MAAKVKFNPGAATLPAADGRREARGEFTGWQTRSARPLRRADGIFLSSNPFPMKPPDYIHSNRCNLCAAAFMIGEQMAEVKRERREKKYSGVMNECSVSEWVGWKKAGIIVARVWTKKRMWTQMKNVYGASCVVDVEAKIDINGPTGVYYICMRKKWICPNVQMSINNTAGGDDIISQVVHVVFISLPPTDALKTALMQTNHFLGLFLFLIARFFFFSNVTHISRTN